MAACPDDGSLARLLDATLPAGQRFAIEGHLDACGRCSALVAELAGGEPRSSSQQKAHVCTACGASYAAAGICALDGAEIRTSDDPLVGRDVGPYRIAHPLGAGGMGRVYAAIHRQVAARVALKVINLDHSADPELVNRFFIEARAVNRIDHAGVVKVLDLIELPDHRPAIVMERIAGPTLRAARLTTVDAVVDVLVEVLSALAAAHEIGIVHRDLKPDNIIVSATGPKLLDFGIAKVVDLPPGQPAARTRTNACLGTPGYMAPEQIRGGAIDARSDIYAVGVIAFELLAGRRPFGGASDFEIMRGHLEADAPNLCALRPDVPAGLASVVACALAKRPADRFASAAAFAGALRSACRAPRPRRRERRAARATITLAAAIAGCLLWRGEVSPATAAMVTPAATGILTGAQTRAAPAVPVLPTALTSRPTRAVTAAATRVVTAAATTRAVTATAIPPARPPDRSARVAVPGPILAAPPAAAPPLAPAMTGSAGMIVDHVPAHLDPIAYLPTALELARRLEPDAELVKLTASPVSRDGSIAVSTPTRSEPQGGVAYEFASATRARDLATGPTARCAIVVVIMAGATQAVVGRNERHKCSDKPVALPRCSATQVWAKAIARGAPPDAIAHLAWTGQWSFSVLSSLHPMGFKLEDDC